MKFFVSTIFISCVTAEASFRPERNALPQDIFRESVEPSKGGKVPEAAHLRVELNMIDSAGLRDPEGIRMEQLMAAESPELLDHMLQDTNSRYHPGLTPVLKLRPGYTPAPDAYPLKLGYGAEPAYKSPGPAYTPEPYSPPAPVGPVLLENRPHEVKSVQPLPITVSETYTSFDCRSKPNYPGRHYADVETGCEVYHFCHEDGKQDTFQCGYGTAFNEYIGTCDFKNSVQCVPGEGYTPKQAPYTSAPYHQPAPYKAPTPYVAPAPYHQPIAYHEPASHQQPAPYHTAGPALKPFTNF